MKYFVQRIAFGFIAWCLILSSCSIEKRKYMSGYDVHKLHASKRQEIPIEKFNSYEHVLAGSTNQSASDILSPQPIFQLNAPEPFQNETTTLDSCDRMNLKDGSVMNVKVTQVLKDEVLFKACPDSNGKELWISKSKVSAVNYLGGRREEMTIAEPQSVPVRGEVSMPSQGGWKETTAEEIKEKPKKKWDNLAFIGLGAAVLAFLLFAVEVLLNMFGGAGVFFLLGLTALALGVTSLIRIKRRGSKHKGVGFALPAIIAGGIISAISLLVLFVLWIDNNAF